MISNEKNIAALLLECKAIKINLIKPFLWASGWKSPIYCDNRKTLSYPIIRTIIKNSFVDTIKENFSEVEAIAGVATGAIAQGAIIADALNLPFLYVRSSPKSHGMENLIEGEHIANQKVIIIEDLISTGGSSLKAVEALRKVNCNILGMIAIFSYNFDVSQEAFQHANCPLITLSNYSTLVELALETGYINKKESEKLKDWRRDPANWNN